MKRWLSKRIKSDEGNATIILGIMLIVSLIMVGGMMLDFSKAYQLKSAYVDAAKKATQAATMKQNSRGHLTEESIAIAVSTYEGIMRPTVVTPDSYFSKCASYGPDKVDISVTLIQTDSTNKIVAQREYTVKRSSLPKITDPNQSDLIANEVRRSPTYASIRNVIRDGSFRPTEIQLEVTEGTENSVLPVAFDLIQKDGDGMKCQKMEIGAKATTFLGASNNNYD